MQFSYYYLKIKKERIINAEKQRSFVDVHRKACILTLTRNSSLVDQRQIGPEICIKSLQKYLFRLWSIVIVIQFLEY